MKKSTTILFFLLCTSLVYSQPDADFQIKSGYVNGVTYDMAVYLPVSYNMSNNKYPVLYCTDRWVDEMIFPALYKALWFAGAVKEIKMNEIIIVEISCSDDIDALHWKKNRWRDFTPPNLDANLNWITPANSDSAGGAPNFLKFLKHQLIPYVESNYRADTSERGYFGYSFGGLFGIYAMTVEPKLFQRYIIGSPSLWYDDYHLVDKLKNVTDNELSGLERIYLSIGQNEIHIMQDGFRRLRTQFLARNLRTLRFKYESVEGEKHIGAMPHCLYYGMKYLYGQ